MKQTLASTKAEAARYVMQTTGGVVEVKCKHSIVMKCINAFFPHNFSYTRINHYNSYNLLPLYSGLTCFILH